LDGRFKLTGLPAVKLSEGFEVQFAGENYDTQVLAVEEGISLDVVMEKSFPFPNRVAGVVSDASGNPISGASVLVEFHRSALTVLLETNGDGLIVVRVPSEENYPVTVSAEGYVTDQTVASVVSETATANVTLESDSPAEGEDEGEGEGEGEGPTPHMRRSMDRRRAHLRRRG
jgi:hypothetical protein